MNHTSLTAHPELVEGRITRSIKSLILSIALLAFFTDVRAMEENNRELFNTAKAGYVDEVISLINKNANINTVDEMGWTPLDYAIYLGRKEVVAIMLLQYSTLSASELLQKTHLIRNKKVKRMIKNYVKKAKEKTE